jgi:hypothetical protein
MNKNRNELLWLFLIVLSLGQQQPAIGMRPNTAALSETGVFLLEGDIFSCKQN